MSISSLLCIIRHDPARCSLRCEEHYLLGVTVKNPSPNRLGLYRHSLRLLDIRKPNPQFVDADVVLWEPYKDCRPLHVHTASEPTLSAVIVGSNWETSIALLDLTTPERPPPKGADKRPWTFDWTGEGSKEEGRKLLGLASHPVLLVLHLSVSLPTLKEFEATAQEPMLSPYKNYQAGEEDDEPEEEADTVVGLAVLHTRAPFLQNHSGLETPIVLALGKPSIDQVMGISSTLTSPQGLAHHLSSSSSPPLCGGCYQYR